MMAAMTTETPFAGRDDPLYLRARQLVLFRRDPGIATLQRALRIGHQHATRLRDAMRGDILNCDEQGHGWHFTEGAGEGPDPLLQDKLAQAAHWIGTAQAMVVAAGAGMGIDSGLQFGNMGSPEALQQRPAAAWGIYGQQLNLYRAAAPHAGFGLIRAWGQRMQQGCFVFTSNVDGHFQKAGFPSARVYECRGSIHRLQCVANCEGSIWSTADLRPQVDEAACEWRGELPTCPRCGALARPNILMTDDWRWNETRSAQQRMLLDMWLDSVQAPLVLEIGAGRAVPTVRNFTRRMQLRGSRLIRINLHEANIHNPGDIELALGARQALQALGTRLAASQGSTNNSKEKADGDETGI